MSDLGLKSKIVREVSDDESERKIEVSEIDFGFKMKILEVTKELLENNDYFEMKDMAKKFGVPIDNSSKKYNAIMDHLSCLRENQWLDVIDSPERTKKYILGYHAKNYLKNFDSFTNKDGPLYKAAKRRYNKFVEKKKNG